VDYFAQIAGGKMKNMLAVLPVLVLVLVLPALSTAGDLSDVQAARRKQVEVLLELMDADAMIDRVYTQTDQMLREMAAQMEIQPSEKAVFDDFASKIIATMKADLNWARMKEPMIDLYLKHYTDQEVKDITAFYKTPSGQSMLKKMPLVMQDSLRISQQMMKDTYPKIQDLMKDLEAEIDKGRDTH
jgi:hypothetical protein